MFMVYGFNDDYEKKQWPIKNEQGKHESDEHYQERFDNYMEAARPNDWLNTIARMWRKTT